MSASGLTQQPASRRGAPRRLFTIEQANRALPLVRRIVTDIVEEYRSLAQQLAIRESAGDVESAVAARDPDDPAQASVTRLNELISELHVVGCELKDWETGLVDFRADRAGETVYLCWRLGEEQVTHWHELHAGVAGRKPIDFTGVGSAGDESAGLSDPHTRPRPEAR